MTRRSLIGLVTAAACSAALVAACGSEAPAASFGAEAAWARPTPTGATNGVIYLTVSSDVADALVGAEVPTSIAASTELHATMGGDSGGGHSHGGDGGDGEMMSMGAVESFPIAAGETLTFAPGGNHIMLIDVAEPLTRDTRFTVTLQFASGRSLDVPVVVADNPPG
jgi:copper(I)-binding protein